MPPDQDELELGDEDSLLESDWEKYTSIEPKIYLELNKDESCICDSKRAFSNGYGRNNMKCGKWKVAPEECESGNVPNEIFVPTILECDSLNYEYTLETKDNCTVYIKNTTVCITDSDDLDRPQKLVKSI